MSVFSCGADESPVSIVDLVLGQHCLDDIAVLRAIGRRLAEAGLNEPVDKVVADARAGKEWAVDLIQTVELPAPIERLPMPIQSFGDRHLSHWSERVLSRLTSTRKGHA